MSYSIMGNPIANIRAYTARRHEMSDTDLISEKEALERVLVDATFEAEIENLQAKIAVVDEVLAERGIAAA